MVRLAVAGERRTMAMKQARRASLAFLHHEYEGVAEQVFGGKGRAKARHDETGRTTGCSPGHTVVLIIMQGYCMISNNGALVRPRMPTVARPCVWSVLAQAQCLFAAVACVRACVRWCVGACAGACSVRGLGLLGAAELSRRQRSDEQRA